jgi:hypothetical protein
MGHLASHRPCTRHSKQATCTEETVMVQSQALDSCFKSARCVTRGVVAVARIRTLAHGIIWALCRQGAAHPSRL